jgi:hypothetical protein
MAAERFRLACAVRGRFPAGEQIPLCGGWVIVMVEVGSRRRTW